MSVFLFIMFSEQDSICKVDQDGAFETGMDGVPIDSLIESVAQL